MRGFDGALPLSVGGERAGRNHGAPGYAGGKPERKREPKKDGRSRGRPRTIRGQSADDQRTISGRSASDQRPIGSTQAPDSQGQSKRRGGLDYLEPESNNSIKEGKALPEQKIERHFFKITH